MPRLPSVRKSASLDVHIDEELRTLLDIRLWSTAEQRVPKGAYKAFFDALLARELKGSRLDLAPFLGTQPEEFVVSGSKPAIAALQNYLEQK